MLYTSFLHTGYIEMNLFSRAYKVILSLDNMPGKCV